MVDYAVRAGYAAVQILQPSAETHPGGSHLSFAPSQALVIDRAEQVAQPLRLRFTVEGQLDRDSQGHR